MAQADSAIRTTCEDVVVVVGDFLQILRSLQKVVMCSKMDEVVCDTSVECCGDRYRYHTEALSVTDRTGPAV